MFFLWILPKSVFISQGNSHAKMRKLALSWNPTGIIFAKRYLFCFESMLRLQNDKKVGNRNPFSFNLTPVKSLRGENHKIQLKNDHVSWTWFQEKCSKVKKPSFRNARTPAGFRLLQSEDFVIFVNFLMKQESIFMTFDKISTKKYSKFKILTKKCWIFVLQNFIL